MHNLDVRGVQRQLVTSLAIEGSDLLIEDIEQVPESESSTAEAIETIGDVAEVDNLNDEAEELQTVGEAGDELLVAVESAIASKRGLTPFESVALKLTVKQLTKKYSKSFSELVPARENFGGIRDQLETTVLAHEDLRGGFESFWDTTKKQFLKVIEAIQKFFRGIIQKFTSVTKRAQSLIARAQDASQDNGGTVELSPSNLTVGGEALNQAVPAGLTNILDVINELLKNTRGIDDRAEVNQGVEAIKDGSAWDDYVNNVNSHSKRTFDAIQARDENVTTLLPGNRAITYTAGEANSVDQFSFESIVHFETGKTEGKEQVPALTRKEIIVVANAIIHIAKAVDDFDKIWARNSSKAARLIQGLTAAMKSDSKKQAEAQDGEAGEEESRLARFKVNSKALLNHVRRLDKFNSDLVAYAQLVSLDALAYGELSLNENHAVATTENP